MTPADQQEYDRLLGEAATLQDIADTAQEASERRYSLAIDIERKYRPPVDPNSPDGIFLHGMEKVNDSLIKKLAGVTPNAYFGRVPASGKFPIHSSNKLDKKKDDEKAKEKKE